MNILKYKYSICNIGFTIDENLFTQKQATISIRNLPPANYKKKKKKFYLDIV